MKTLYSISLWVAVGFVVASAQAGFVPLSGPAAGEASQAEILESIYSPGAPWMPFGSRVDGTGRTVDLSNGSLQAIRVDDFGLGGVLAVNGVQTAMTDDSIWAGGPVAATAGARYAAYSQKFGYDLDGDGTGYINLFDVSGSGMNVTGSGTLDPDPGQTYAWGRSGDGGTYFSDPARNVGGLDHLVTYRLTGLTDGQNHWVFFWEDLPDLGDHDYNDLAVTIAAPVPEPQSALLTVIGLGLAAARRRRAA